MLESLGDAQRGEAVPCGRSRLAPCPDRLVEVDQLGTVRVGDVARYADDPISMSLGAHRDSSVNPVPARHPGGAHDDASTAISRLEEVEIDCSECARLESDGCDRDVLDVDFKVGDVPRFR